MEINQLNSQEDLGENKKLTTIYHKTQKLIDALNKHDIPPAVATIVNQDVNLLNRFDGTEKALTKELNKAYNRIVKLVLKELKLVPKGYYRTLWMSLGMSAFGVSFGTAFSVALDNFAFLGIGIPIGMAIGIAIGTGLDAKAAKEGRQLDV